MNKKDALDDGLCPNLFEELMTDNNFEPFGAFFALGRHLNPITQDTVDTSFVENVSKDISILDPEYIREVTSKTKDDAAIFNTEMRFNPVIENSIFSEESIVEFPNELYKKLKLKNSQEILFHDSLKRKYFYLFKVRCLLYQPTDLLQAEKKQKLKMYEYASFDLIKMKDTKLIEDINLTLDFVLMTASTTKEGVASNIKFNFKEVEGANAGYVSDEFYLTLKQREVSPIVMKFKAKYSFQRDLIVEVFNLVHHFCRKYPKKSQTTYTNDDANLHRQEHANKLESLKIRRTVLSIIKSDNIIPPKALLSYLATFKVKDKKIKANFTLGINNIVIHTAQYQEDKLQPEPKLKTREKKLYDYIFSVIPHNHSYFYADQGEVPFDKKLNLRLNSEEMEFEFENPVIVSNILTAIKAVQHGQIMNDQIFVDIQTPHNESEKQIREKFLKAKYKEVHKLISFHRDAVRQLQSAKTVLDYEYYKDFEAYVPDNEKEYYHTDDREGYDSH